jgi:hypothetical protein
MSGLRKISGRRESTNLIECKASDEKLQPVLVSFAEKWPQAQAVQIVGDLRQPQTRKGIHILDAGQWLAQLAA